MTVKLRGPAGGVIEIDDDRADVYLNAGYTKADAPAAKPEVKKRAKPRKEG